jgi:hypothetical protein
MDHDEFERQLRRFRLWAFMILTGIILLAIIVPIGGAIVFIYRDDVEAARTMASLAVAPGAVAAFLTLLGFLARRR